MQIQQEATVLHAFRWKMEETGMSGIKFKMVNPDKSNEQDKVGADVIEASAPIDLWGKVSAHRDRFPGRFMVVCSLRQSGKAIKLIITDLEPLNGK